MNIKHIKALLGAACMLAGMLAAPAAHAHFEPPQTWA